MVALLHRLDDASRQRDHRSDMKRTICCLALAGLLAGCSSAANGAGSHSSASSKVAESSSAAPTFVTDYGTDAAIIASHVPGCSAVQAGSVGKGAPFMSSTASCALTGHLVIFDSVASDPNLSELVSQPLWRASGKGWVAFLADADATAADTVLQMQLTNDAAGLTRRAFDGKPENGEAVDLGAQETLTKQIALALGGEAELVPAGSS